MELWNNEQLMIEKAEFTYISHGHECRHCEHSGHSESNSSRGGIPAEPERNPRDNNDKDWWQIDLDDVKADVPFEQEKPAKAGILAWN